MRHFLNLDDLLPDEVERLLERADALRGKRTLTTLAGKAVVMVFFDPSLRTRVSMELAAQELGARAVVLSPGKDSWTLEARDGAVMDGDRTEHVKEAAKVLSRYGDCLAVRAFPKRKSWEEDAADPVLAAFARHATVPVINLESSLYHPCQSLADVYTIRRALGVKPGGALSWRGSGRPSPGHVLLTWANHPKALPTAVPNSFALAATQQGMDLTIAHPEGYDLPPEVIARCRASASRAGSALEITHDRDAAYDGARVVYAKSWGRLDMYGKDEEEIAQRKARGLARWIVDAGAMARTADARFMHCLPVRRNVVVADDVIDSPASIIYDQAENRLHVQKAVLESLMA